MAYAAGVDVGSTQTKAVIIDEERHIVGRSLIDTGANVVARPRRRSPRRSRSAGVEEREVGYVVGTGYGRYRVTFGNTQVTEISLPWARRGAHVPGHAHGRRHGRAGHQGDSRRAERRDRRLLHERQVRRRDGAFPRRGRGGARHPARTSSARSRSGASAPSRSAPRARSSPSPRCCRGSARARRSRTSCSASTSRSPRAPPGSCGASVSRPEVTFTGGVAKEPGHDRRRSIETLGLSVNVSDESHYMGALGAALFALDHILSSRAPAAARHGGRHEPSPRASTSDPRTPRPSCSRRRRDRRPRGEPDRFSLARGRARHADDRARRRRSRRDDVRVPRSRPATAATRWSSADLRVTDLTAAARGARFLFPRTHTILDVGGQT